LIVAGAEIEQKDSDGFSALDAARAAHYDDIAKILTNAGAE
jgi:hypothetical protein